MTQNYKPLKVYKSSAGSGKTTTLALEYLKLALGKPENFKHILALTFTNKAAQEMKDRILEYLQQIIDFGKNKIEEPFFLKKLISETSIYLNLSPEKGLQNIFNDAESLYKNIIHRYSEYAVTTIDSFTNRIIKSFSHDLGLSFNYQVELKTDLMIQLAVEELLSRINKDESLLTKVLTSYSQSKINNEKSRNIRNDLKSRAYSLLKDSEEEYLVDLRLMSLEDLQAIQVELDQSITDFEISIQKIALDFINLCKNNGIEPSSFFQSRGGIYPYFQRISKSDFSKLQPNSYVLKTIEDDKWTSGKTSNEQLYRIDNIKDELLIIYRKLQELIGLFNYKLRKEISTHIFPFMILLELETILNQMKSDQQMIHISDFNKVISKNVANETAPYIYERIGNKFNHYLLDEFQDTSVIQWHNLIPLVENGISQNYFSLVVGDAKQSIYRWRGSDVKQFSEFPKLSKPTNDEYMIQRQNLLNQSYEDVFLAQNYRTGKNIVEFNNQLFQLIKTQGYLPDSQKEIYDNSLQEIHKTDTESCVQIHTIDAKNIGDKEEIQQEYIEKVFQLVQQSHRDGYQLKDIAILARKNHILINIAQFLLSKNIPVISTESLHADSSPLVRFVLSFIHYLYHPAESLYQSEMIFFLAQNDYYKTKFDHLQAITALQPKDELKHFWKSLEIEFNAKGLLEGDPYESVESICEIFHLDKTDALLHFFIEATFIFSQENHQDLSSFLEWWSVNASDYKLDVPEDWEAVKLLSFHKAKGLEFPVVINLFGESHFTESNFNSPEIWLNPELKDIPQLKSFPFKISSLKDTKFHYLYEMEHDFATLDKINLFYVAMTRPKERLHLLVDTYHPAKSKSSESNAFKFNKLVDDFINHSEMKEIDHQTYQYGETNLKHSLSKNNGSTNPTVTSLKHEDWKHHIQMSLETDTSKMAATDWGNKVHQFFSKIKNEEDLEKHVAQSKIMLQLSDKELEDLVQKAKQVMAHPQVSALYKKDHLILNERDFYTSDQEILRPDRIVKKQDQLYILDYKTGKPSEEDKHQMMHYCRELKQITGLATYGYLVYLHEKLIVQEF